MNLYLVYNLNNKTVQQTKQVLKIKGKKQNVNETEHAIPIIGKPRQSFTGQGFQRIHSTSIIKC